MDYTPHGKKNEKPQDQFDKILHNKRCPIHPKSNHSMWECTILRKSFQLKPPDAPKKKQNKDGEDDKKDPDRFCRIAILVSPPRVYPAVEFQDGDLRTKSSIVT
jgi:hypothetical protein